MAVDLLNGKWSLRDLLIGENWTEMKLNPDLVCEAINISVVDSLLSVLFFDKCD